MPNNGEVITHEVVTVAGRYRYVDAVTKEVMVKVRVEVINQIVEILRKVACKDLPLVTMTIASDILYTLTISRWWDENKTHFTVRWHNPERGIMRERKRYRRVWSKFRRAYSYQQWSEIKQKWFHLRWVKLGKEAN